MRVHRTRGLAGAGQARGTAIVIDVLRAFTTAACALAPRPEGGGASAIWLVSTPEEALALRAGTPELVLVGEVGGKPIPGFDHGNSPERMLALGDALAGRTLVLRSSSGVQGALAAAAVAERVLLGSLVTAAATVRAARASADVTLVAMGSPAGPDGPEDDACAELLEHRLLGRPDERARIAAAVRASPAARQALDPALDWITPGDLECALAFDRFDFAIEARIEAGRLVARRVLG